MDTWIYCYLLLQGYGLLLLLVIQSDICLSNSFSDVDSLFTKAQLKNLFFLLFFSFYDMEDLSLSCCSLIGMFTSQH